MRERARRRRWARASTNVWSGLALTGAGRAGSLVAEKGALAARTVVFLSHTHRHGDFVVGSTICRGSSRPWDGVWRMCRRRIRVCIW